MERFPPALTWFVKISLLIEDISCLITIWKKLAMQLQMRKQAINEFPLFLYKICIRLVEPCSHGRFCNITHRAQQPFLNPLPDRIFCSTLSTIQFGRGGRNIILHFFRVEINNITSWTEYIFWTIIIPLVLGRNMGS